MTCHSEAVQMDIFSELYPKFVIDKPIRLIELFAGIGSQAKALKNLGADFEHYKVVEFDKYAIASYNAVHGTNFDVLDIRNVHASDLEITERDKYCYLLTYSFPCQDLSVAGLRKGMKKGRNELISDLIKAKNYLKQGKSIEEISAIISIPKETLQQLI